MISFFNRLFNIRTFEWPRLLLLYVMLFIFVLGTGWGTAIVEAAFLEQVGVKFLPWILIAIAVISIPANAIYTAFADRVANDKLLIAILGIGMVGIILGLGLLWAGIPLAYPLLYLLIYVPLSDILVLQWFTYVNGFYDTRAAKRIIPVIVTSPRVAGIIAGLTMPLINRFLPPPGTILLWAVACGIMGGLIWLMPHLGFIRRGQQEVAQQPPHIQATGTPSKSQSGGHAAAYLDNLREGYQYVIQSRFLRWMALSTFLFTILIAFLNVQASQIFYDELKTMEKISNFIGVINGVTNLIMLPFLLFGLSRIINTIGLGNANLIYPTGTLAISGALVFWPGLTTAALAYFARNAFVAGIRNPIDSLLYNAVPLRIKGRARAFIGGLIVPIGSLVGNGILLVLTSKSISERNALQYYPPGLILLTALSFLISALFIRKQYGQALVQMLEQEDYSFLLSQRASELTIVDPAALESLHKRLRESISGSRTSPLTLPEAASTSRSHEMTVFLAQLISQIGGREAFPILEEAAKTVLEARTRAAIIDILALADIPGKAVRYLCLDFLDDPEGRVRQAAIIALEKIVETKPLALPRPRRCAKALPSEEIAGLRPQMLKMTQDPDLDVRVQALSVLARTAPDSFPTLDQEPTSSSDTNPAAQALQRLLTAEDSHPRAMGVQILGQMVLRQNPNVHALQSLLTYLRDPADEVRLQATMAVENITATLPPKAAGATKAAIEHKRLPETLRKSLEEAVSQSLQDPVERIRQAAITILGRIGTRTAHAAMLDALTDPSPQVRAIAVDALAQVGKSIIPLIHPKLDATASSALEGRIESINATRSANATKSIQKMATVILCRISPREFGGLIQANIMGNLLHIYHNYGYVAALMPYAEMPGINILQNALTEHNQQLVDEIFYLLTAIHDPAAIEIISESLHSEAPRARANATEALESLTTPQTASLVAQAIQVPTAAGAAQTSNIEASLQPLLALGQDAWDMPPPDTGEALRQLIAQSDDAWLRALAVFAIGEIGRHIRHRQQPIATTARGKRHMANSPTAKGTGATRRRRSRRPNLLDALTEKLVETPSTTTPASTNAIPAADATKERDMEIAATSATDTSQTAPFTLPEIETILEKALHDPVEEVRHAAQIALATKAAGATEAPKQRTSHLGEQYPSVDKEEKVLLSTIEKIIFLKEVPFFRGMTVDQLRVLAAVCEEELFEEDTRIFNEGDPGGVLYVVVQGRVGIEQESQRKGSFARLATIEAHSYFGEMNLFDNSPRTASAIAIQDTLTLRLRREPLIALARQHPNLSLELINVLSARLREAQDAIAERTRTKPRELQKLYDQFR